MQHRMGGRVSRGDSGGGLSQYPSKPGLQSEDTGTNSQSYQAAFRDGRKKGEVDNRVADEDITRLQSVFKEKVVICRGD